MSDTTPVEGERAILDFKEIADATPSLIWVSNEKKEGVWFNRTWLEYTGATLEEELGEGWLRRICAEDVGAIDECVQAFAEQRSFRTEFRLRRADGAYRWMIDTGVPRYSADGRFAGFVGSLVDIEDRKAAEEQRNLLSNGLQPSRLATMTAMASAFAHELNQPLAAICNYVRAARRLAGGPKGNRMLIEPLDAAETCAMRAGDIIRGMRATVSRASPARKRVDLRALIKESLLLAELTMGRKNGIIVDVAVDMAVHVDAVKIQQVLVNLLRNAVEACAGEAAPRITVAAAAEEEHVRISVEDNGHGFAEAQGRARFEPFRTTKAAGLGLGLPICQNIVEAHAGRLWIDATSPAGTRVCFTVPKDQPAQAQGSAASARVPLRNPELKPLG